MVSLPNRDVESVMAPFMECINQGLVRSVEKLTKYTSVFPNTTMEAEWDCLAQVLQTIKALGKATPTIAHIKGHQDAKTPYERLLLPTQLNCNADTLASAYLQENSTLDHTISWTFPAGEGVLHLRHGTITRNLKWECAEARNLPPLRSKIISDSEWWSPSVFDAVDWSAHGRALTK